MKKALTLQIIESLPWHDADLLSVYFHTSTVGETNLVMNVQIDPEESFQAFAEIGIKKNMINLHFEKCWKINASFLSYKPHREQVFDWKASSDSDELKSFRKLCVPEVVNLLHHAFEFSGGSTFEVMAEKIFIEDVPLTDN